MSDKARIVHLTPAPERDLYRAARRRLTDQLIRYTLVESFFQFTNQGKPYPFQEPGTLLPQAPRRSTEHLQQNAVLMVLLDGTLPRPLNKHFRLRTSNRVSWRNIRRLAPDLDLSDFEAAHCRLADPGFEGLLARLLPLDYMLLAEQEPHGSDGPAGAIELTHMHVKVERLTDNAVKDLGKRLGLIERRLFERGEDFAEELEAKFFEYYGFSSNASGRKSAAAMAAQLLAGHDMRFTVFVAGQEDCRLTQLDDSEEIQQHMLVQLAGAELERFCAALVQRGIGDLTDYSVSGLRDGPQTVLYRLRLNRSEAVRQPTLANRDERMRAPWLEIAEEMVVPRPGVQAPEIPFSWPGGGAGEPA